MEQLKLPMLTVYSGPRLIDLEFIDACRSYREAVRACWDGRTRRNLTQRLAAEECGAYPSHFSDYISKVDDGTKRDLPARLIPLFELVAGNRFITQWNTRQAGLTILEQYIDRRVA